MIWLALPLTAWACAAAYGIWAWRDDRRAERNAAREQQERTEKSRERMQALIRQWANVRETTPATTPFPASGDNFTTLEDDKVVEFGKRPRPDGDGGNAA